MMTEYVITVQGKLQPSELGITHTHEHLISDLSGVLATQSEPPSINDYGADIGLHNYYETRREHANFDDLRLDNATTAIEEVKRYAEAGGNSIVEASSIGLGRDPLALLAISDATDVNIVMGSSFYVDDLQPSWVTDRTEDELAEIICTDLNYGVDDTGVRAGIIGEVGLSWPPTRNEDKTLAASAQAQARTGAAVLLHPGRNEAAPFEHLKAFRSYGGDVQRTIMSHVDRTLFNDEDILRLAETGCYVEFDLFGQESSYYPNSDIDMPNDSKRVQHIHKLIEHGFGNRILIAQDICHKTFLQAYGGEGYSHILRHVVPLMQRRGITAEEVRSLLISNPKAILTQHDSAVG